MTAPDAPRGVDVATCRDDAPPERAAEVRAFAAEVRPFAWGAVARKP
ncbi:hypothetical protein [Amycolatopsis echigonensis]|uniref:Uncharacterized protein n=1 Tax=Amycolatopsis echigonensis TaxID=2576905 RepID=A0A2N3WE36_9PSEU|nr:MULTISPECIES: hypothetical protein [Amycolatopsis]MBB2499677.1 hypothetical protein [Amycolatopsis echigonensis]PKV92164.1 hypothetical protein ATK30_2958 [Amycolatopsis niigatensis]